MFNINKFLTTLGDKSLEGDYLEILDLLIKHKHDFKNEDLYHVYTKVYSEYAREYFKTLITDENKDYILEYLNINYE